MLNQYLDPLLGFNVKGTNAHVNMGWLQTPAEFADACLDLAEQPDFGTWALRAQLPQEVVKLLQNPLVPNAAGIGLLFSHQRVLYPVITLQAAGLQVRILLCLANPETQDWFRAVASDGNINVAIDSPDAVEVAVIAVPCQLASVVDVEELIGQCASLSDLEAFLRDAAMMVKKLTEPTALPSILPGFETHDLRLVAAFESGIGADKANFEAKARVLN